MLPQVIADTGDLESFMTCAGGRDVGRVACWWCSARRETVSHVRVAKRIASCLDSAPGRRYGVAW